MNPFSHFPSYNPLAMLKTTGLINYNGFSLSETPSLAGKVAVITGGQSGIGKELSAQLLLHGISKVYILARSEEKYGLAKQTWAQREGIESDDVESRTVFVPCNLTDMRDVKRVGDMLVAQLERLDILINHAGMPNVPEYTLSEQGIETIFATNHVGHFILTNILLPLLESTAASQGSARVVVTTSSFHMACQEIDFRSLMSPARVKSPAILDSCYRYARSKLANILFTRELTSRLAKKGMSNVYVNCFFPGNIPTEGVDTWKQLLGTVPGALLKGVFRVIGQSEVDAAATAIFLAASDEVLKRDLKGKYFVPIATDGNTSTVADDKDLAKNLWYWTDHKVTEFLGNGWASDE
ncbi:MAG: hypothetical protein M1816_001911 [Peltula sp. TS41687]|nr:MAG: hypothetical protein M1816_001911 [Peltula sp. TS41687]